MAPDKRLWSLYDGQLVTAGTAGVVTYADTQECESPVSYSSWQRSVSSSSASSTASDFPLVPEKQLFKVPLHVARSLASRGFEVDDSGKVTWRKSSPSHPRNWSVSRKVYDAAVIIFLDWFTTLVSNTGSSTAAEGAADLDVSRQTALICFTTTYLLAQALGGLILPPIAETFGGRTLYIAGAAGFTAACVAMAASPTLGVVIAGRLVCGFMSALPSTVAVSSFENMFNTRARIWVFHIWGTISNKKSAIGKMLWWFGLTVPPLTKGLSPWIPIASLALVGFSVVEFDTVLAGYLTDTYTSHAASANASLSFLRALLSGVLPLFGHRVFAGLGPNNAMFVRWVCDAVLWSGSAVRQVREINSAEEQVRATHFGGERSCRGQRSDDGERVGEGLAFCWQTGLAFVV